MILLCVFTQAGSQETLSLLKSRRPLPQNGPGDDPSDGIGEQ